MIGRIYNTKAQNTLALQYCQIGLKILTEVGNRGRVGWAHYHLGRIYETLKDVELSRRFYELASSILRETGDRR
jgi:hypothetical protein